MSIEAQKRKERSIEKLVEDGVPFHQSLPCIEVEDECSFRIRRHVVQRAWALNLVLAKAFGTDPIQLLQAASDSGIADWFSPKERAFLKTKPSPDSEYRQWECDITWRYESLWVLLWALGFIAKLPYPSAQCNANVVNDIFNEYSIDEFFDYPITRSHSDILDQADLHYRYHWAVTDARIRGDSVPSLLEPSVVFERHYALNWLIGYQGQEWDDITTDT